MKAKTRSILTVCLALALVASAVLGTIAYMTATDDKTNTFTVGKFSNPTDPTDPSGGDLNGYLVEPSWKEDSKLIPGGSVAKDPKVGIGKGSEEAYIYVYVENKVLKDTTTEKYVTFTLNTGWEAVDGQVVEGDNGTYVSGLFKYSDTLKPDADNEAWTSEVFKTVDVSADANTGDFADNPQMIIYAFIHQAKDGSGNPLADTANTAAIEWAKNPSGN